MSIPKIDFFSDCGHSPAWPNVGKALLELDAAGLSFQPVQHPVWNDPCLIAISATGRLMGYLIYRYDEPKCAWFILLAYTLPRYRRRRVHTSLFDALVARARKRGDILSIDSGTHVNNLQAQAAFAAQGRQSIAIMYQFRLRDWLDGKPHLDTPRAEP